MNDSQTSKEEKKEEKKEANNDKIFDPSEMSLHPPFWSKIKDSKTILLSGCGGGFDIYQGIPLYFQLKSMGYQVYFANLTFCFGISSEADFEFWYDTKDKNKDKEPLVVKVSASEVPLKKIKHQNYFPEYYLSLYFKQSLKMDVPVYVFPHNGFVPLKKAYEMIVDKLKIDTVITIDGGTDSLMKGDECGVGTVEEDYASIFAVEAIKNKNVKNKFLVCLGFGVDRYHGVSDVSTLRAIAELTRTQSYLGCIQLLPWMKPCKIYRSASEFSYKYMKSSISIVGSSILTAIEGKFGDEHWKGNSRTKGSKLFINPLMGIYWIFDNHGVYQRIDKRFKKEYAKCTGDSFQEIRVAVRKARQQIMDKNDIFADHENYPATDDLKHKAK